MRCKWNAARPVGKRSGGGHWQLDRQGCNLPWQTEPTQRMIVGLSAAMTPPALKPLSKAMSSSKHQQRLLVGQGALNGEASRARHWKGGLAGCRRNPAPPRPRNSAGLMPSSALPVTTRPVKGKRMSTSGVALALKTLPEAKAKGRPA